MRCEGYPGKASLGYGAAVLILGKRRLARGIAGVGVALGLAVGVAMVPAGSAQAVGLTGSVLAQDSGLHESSRSSYVVDDKARAVRVRTSVTIRNDTPNSGGKYYFFVGYRVPVPAGATSVRAKSNGSSLPVQMQKSTISTMKWANVHFSDLYYGHARTITWTYTLKGGAFRSKDSVRVGPGYAAFPVLTDSDVGDATVDVEIPKNMTFAASSDEFKEQKGGGSTVTWRATAGPKEEGIWAGVSARDPKQTDKRTIKVGRTKLALQAFPGDKAWLDFVEKHVDQGLPELEKVMGAKWPGGLKTIREDVASEVVGYSWFNTETHEIVLGEDLDEELLYHELSHAWINQKKFQGRWLIEGLAQVVARRTVTALHGKLDPHPTPKVNHKLPLSGWESDSQLGTQDVYGYDASYAAVSGMLAPLSSKQVTQVLAASYHRLSGYERPGSYVGQAAYTSWRRFLDLVEQRSGEYSVEKRPQDALAKWALARDDVSLLSSRGYARARYRTADAENGGWQVPRGLREEMALGDYPSADDPDYWMTSANRAAEGLQQAAGEYRMQPSRAIRREYEDFDSDEPADALTQRLVRAGITTARVGEAAKSVKTADDPASRFGRWLIGADRTIADARHQLDAGHLAAADHQARLAVTLKKWAPWAAVVFLVVVIAALVGLVLFWRRYGTRVPGWLRAGGSRVARGGRAAVALGRRGVVGVRARAQARTRAQGSAGTPPTAPPVPPVPPGPTGPPPGPPGPPPGSIRPPAADEDRPKV